MCSPASVILTSIVTILVSFEAILKRISVNINFRSQFQNCLKTYKYYTSRWTHFSSIGLILVSIITILTSIVTILVSIKQVNSCFDWIPTPMTETITTSSKGKTALKRKSWKSHVWHYQNSRSLFYWIFVIEQHSSG